jgi:hypothetical protein
MDTWFFRNFSFQDKICSDEYFLAYLGSFCSLNDADCVSNHEYGHLFRILERLICECWFPANLHWDSIFHTPNNEKFPFNSTEGMECKRTIDQISCYNRSAEILFSFSTKNVRTRCSRIRWEISVFFTNSCRLYKRWKKRRLDKKLIAFLLIDW